MSIEEFALATGGEDALRLARNAHIISDAIQFHGDAAIKDLFRGAGLCGTDADGYEGEHLSPTVLYHSEEGSHSTEGYLFDALRTVLGGDLELLKGVRFIPVSHGFRYSNPGSEVIGSSPGRMGPHVRWPSGRAGFLTAGHVAQQRGGTVTDQAGGRLGTVVWTNDPALARSGSPDVDVAVCAFAPGHNATVGTTMVVAGSGQTVRVASSGSSCNIFGFFGYVDLGSPSAAYSDCYATRKGIASPGDSGGVAETPAGILGMVIGGFVQRDMTIIQSAPYQLAEIRRRSGNILIT